MLQIPSTCNVNVQKVVEMTGKVSSFSPSQSSAISALSSTTTNHPFPDLPPCSLPFPKRPSIPQNRFVLNSSSAKVWEDLNIDVINTRVFLKKEKEKIVELTSAKAP